MRSVGCSDLTQYKLSTKHVLMVTTNMSFMSWQCSLLLRLFRTEFKLHHVIDFKQILCALIKWFAFLATCTWHNTCCTILLTTFMVMKTTKAAAQKLTAELVHISTLLVTTNRSCSLIWEQVHNDEHAGMYINTSGHFQYVSTLTCHMLTRTMLKPWRTNPSLTLQECWQQGQELLVEQVMTTSPYGAEEAPQQQEVVVGLLCTQGQLHGPVHQLVQVGLHNRATTNCANMAN